MLHTFSRKLLAFVDSLWRLPHIHPVESFLLKKIKFKYMCELRKKSFYHALIIKSLYNILYNIKVSKEILFDLRIWVSIATVPSANNRQAVTCQREQRARER
jgi:hypothetical protein